MVSRRGVTVEFLVVVTLGGLFLILALVPTLAPIIGFDIVGYNKKKATASLTEFSEEISSFCATQESVNTDVEFDFDETIIRVTANEDEWKAAIQENARGITVGAGECESVKICTSPISDSSASVDMDCEAGGGLKSGSVDFKLGIEGQDAVIVPYENSFSESIDDTRSGSGSGGSGSGGSGAAGSGSGTGSDFPAPESISASEIGGGQPYVEAHPDKAFCSPPSGATTVSSESELLDALSSASSGDVVYVSGDARIETDETDITVPGGVTLASNRGCGGSSGGLLSHPSHMDGGQFIQTGGPDAVITGLRIIGFGEYPEDAEESDIKSPDSTEAHGVDAYHENTEVYNNEIGNWVSRGVAVDGANSHIHHNYIHHSLKYQDGYGVDVHSGAPTLVEFNFFNYYRHAIAGNGGGDVEYTARYNIFGPKYVNQQVDIHGEEDCDADNDGESDSSMCGPAGRNMLVHHNTFQGETALSGYEQEHVHFRGVPVNEAKVCNNWFARRKNAIVQQLTDDEPPYDNILTGNNHFGTDEPSSCDIGAPREGCDTGSISTSPSCG